MLMQTILEVALLPGEKQGMAMRPVINTGWEIGEIVASCNPMKNCCESEWVPQ